MKTILAGILTVMAMASQAASLSWGTGTTAITFDGEKLSSSTKAYLVYLGSSSDLSALYTFENNAIKAANSVADAEPLTKPKLQIGRVSGTYADPTATATDVGTQVADGQYFSMFITYTDTAGKTWYNFSSTAGKITGIGDDNTNLASLTFEFNFDNKNGSVKSASQISAGGGWVAVPEPSTAALALAGLALLLKRRRA